MNRDELAEVVWQALRDSGTQSMFTISQAADEVRDALWPVLEQVWAQGYIEGANDQANGDIGTSELTPNPYSLPIDSPPAT